MQCAPLASIGQLPRFSDGRDFKADSNGPPKGFLVRAGTAGPAAAADTAPHCALSQLTRPPSPQDIREGFVDEFTDSSGAHSVSDYPNQFIVKEVRSAAATAAPPIPAPDGRAHPPPAQGGGGKNGSWVLCASSAAERTQWIEQVWRVALPLKEGQLLKESDHIKQWRPRFLKVPPHRSPTAPAPHGAGPACQRTGMRVGVSWPSCAGRWTTCVCVGSPLFFCCFLKRKSCTSRTQVAHGRIQYWEERDHVVSRPAPKGQLQLVCARLCPCGAYGLSPNVMALITSGCGYIRDILAFFSCSTCGLSSNMMALITSGCGLNAGRGADRRGPAAGRHPPVRAQREARPHTWRYLPLVILAIRSPPRYGLL